MSTKPAVIGVSEIVLNVNDLGVMRDFYRNVVGFELHSEVSLETEVADPDSDPTITFLTIAEADTPLGRGGHPQLLALIDYRRHVWAKGHTSDVNPQGSPLNHMAFEISPEDYDAHRQRLTGLGIQLTFSEFPAVNARAMFFVDPEGNRIEFIAHKPRSD
ncbi:MAG: VOC family protein [Planctomycetota bacterium]